MLEKLKEIFIESTGITDIEITKGTNLKKARQKAYEATEWVSFDNKYMRHDIGKAIDEAQQRYSLEKERYNDEIKMERQ